MLILKNFIKKKPKYMLIEEKIKKKRTKGKLTN